jgi:hypothetical protein
MKKQEFISNLTGLLRPGAKATSTFDNGFNAGLIEALKLAENLEDVQPKSLSYFQQIDNAVRKNLSNIHMLSTSQMDDLCLHISQREYLMAIKLYKDATDIGLKEAKEEIDSAKALISQHEYYCQK